MLSSSKWPPEPQFCKNNHAVGRKMAGNCHKLVVYEGHWFLNSLYVLKHWECIDLNNKFLILGPCLFVSRVLWWWYAGCLINVLISAEFPTVVLPGHMLKVRWFQNVLLVTSYLPKNQRNFEINWPLDDWTFNPVLHWTETVCSFTYPRT